MDIDNLLDKLSSEEKEFLDRHIFAPYVRGSTSIHVKISGVVYKLKTAKKRKDGFGVFKATDASNARMIRQAEQHEIDEYLNLFPSVEMILVYNLGRWLAYPANANDFKHRFKSEPALCNVLMVDNANMLDIVVARFDGANFWFDSVKFGTSSEHLSTLRERIEKQNYTLTKELQVGLSPEEEAAFKYTRQFHREATMSDLEKRLNKEFTQVDANVDGFTERGNNVEVRWRDKHTRRTFTSVFNKDTLSVISAGICLSGGDKTFDLKSLVSVCREGHRGGGIYHVGAGGMNENDYWDTYGDRYE